MRQSLDQFVEAKGCDSAALDFILTARGFSEDVVCLHCTGRGYIKDGHGDLKTISIGKLHDGGEQVWGDVHIKSLEGQGKFGNSASARAETRSAGHLFLNQEF